MVIFSSKLSTFARSRSWEKYTPRARTGSCGHLNPKGFSVRFFQAPNHIASVFSVLICNPLTCLSYVLLQFLRACVKNLLLFNIFRGRSGLNVHSHFLCLFLLLSLLLLFFFLFISTKYKPSFSKCVKIANMSP